MYSSWTPFLATLYFRWKRNSKLPKIAKLQPAVLLALGGAWKNLMVKEAPGNVFAVLQVTFTFFLEKNTCEKDYL